jgi:hypothetical protein
MISRNYFGLLVLLLTPSFTAADTIPTLPDTLRHRIEQVLNKAGISFDGEFKSEHFGSSITGEGLASDRRTIETNEYSSVDLDIHARPNTSASGRLIFRMHHNWQNFWGNPGNPIFSRWISIDGTLVNKIPFHVGNFKALYTPLTIYVPEPELLFEPKIFLDQRKDAMDEVFIENHERPLQGLTMGLDIALAPLFEEIHANVLGVRLRNTETSISNNFNTVNPSELSPDFSKLAIGSTFDVRLLKNVSLGGSYLYIADNKMNFSNPIHTDSAQSTSIADGRIKCDLSGLRRVREILKNGNLRVYGEAAFSFDDSASRNYIPGSAAYGGISLQNQIIPACRIDLDVKYISNESNFRNELAQSPTFVGKRIMNIESDSLSNNHYSTFDALYHHVFKFCPSQGTNQWSKAPYAKNAYSNIVYTKEELRGIADSSLDPSFQLIMPFGPATPNRQGISADCNVKSVDSGIQVRALFSALSERTPEIDASTETASSFLQAGIGLSLDISTWLKQLSYPLELSLSFVRSTVRNTKSGFSIKDDFINGSLRWQFWKKTAFLGGIQIIGNTSNQNAITGSQTQKHWLIGMSWQVAATAEVIGSFGQIIVDNPDRLTNTSGLLRYSKDEFRQFLSDISLRVYF